MGKLLAVLLLAALPALAQEQERPTAYEALRMLGAKFGRGAMNHVISITGVDGDPQPETWKILLEGERGGVREVEVTHGRITADRAPGTRNVIGSTESATIKTSRLNLDSSGAFQVASHTADKSNTRFSLVGYTLRTDERGDPVWIVTLANSSGRPVGTIHINCNRGNVTRSEGMFAGATMEDVETDRTDQRGEREIARTGEDSDEEKGPFSGVRSRLRGAFERTQDEARGMFQRVRRSFDDFIERRGLR
jgi:hypothetical protein